MDNIQVEPVKCPVCGHRNTFTQRKGSFECARCSEEILYVATDEEEPTMQPPVQPVESSSALPRPLDSLVPCPRCGQVNRVPSRPGLARCGTCRQPLSASQPPPETPSWHVARPAATRRTSLREWMHSLLGGIGTVAFILLSVVLFAADVSSCFVRVPSQASGVTPRRPKSGNPSDERLVERFIGVWFAAGREEHVPEVWILDGPGLNAASLGAGRFVLWSSLNGLADDHLDAVIAHEVAHDNHQHALETGQLQRIVDFVVSAVGFVFNRDERTTATLKQWTGAVVLPSYSRGQELEADASAVTLLQRSGYALPAATVCRAFVTLRREVGDGGGGFFDSHPAFTDRLQALRTQFPSTATSIACR